MIAEMVVGTVGKILDKVITDPVARQQADIELLKARQDGDFRELETVSKNIMTEAQSVDPWTSRARPGFMYVMYIYLLAAIPFSGLFAFDPVLAENVTKGLSAWFAAMPGELYALFGAGYLGYGHFRTKEKLAGKEAVGLPWKGK